MSLPLGSHKFRLNNVLHVSHLKKNLLSGSQFPKDNSFVVTLHPYGHVISNFYYGSPLFQGQCKGQLYHVSLSC